MVAPPRQKRTPQPLDATRLNDLALAYVARFAVSAAKLETYLKRKLAQRGWGESTEPPVNEIVLRFVAAGYIDDAAYARMKGEALRRRGYGERRIGQALQAAGVGEDDRGGARGSEQAARLAALAYARRRRLGPFGPAADRAGREKQLGALLRAGHRGDLARAILDAQDATAAEEWVSEAAEDLPDATGHWEIDR